MKQNIIATIECKILVLLFLGVGLSSVARAEEDSIERARHHMELGQDAYEAGRFEDAAAEFVRAHGILPFAAFLYNAGLAWEKAAVHEKAVEFYRRYLDAEPEAADVAQVEMKIRALLPGVDTPAGMSREGGPSEGAPAEGTSEETPGEQKTVEITEVEMKSLISVRTNPADAEVHIIDPEGNAVASSKGPAAHTVAHGAYTIEASHPDFRTVRTKITVSPGEVYVVVVEMSQGAFLGFLHIETDVPGADVYVGDRARGKVGVTPFGNVFPAGEHKIWVEKPGYKPIEKTVTVNLGEKLAFQLKLERLSVGVLAVKANVDGAEVFLDNVSLGPAPLEKQVQPGRHRLKVVAEGMKDYQKQIVVSRGQLTKALVRMNPKPSRTSAWVSLGFSAAFFAGGGVAGIMALRLNNDLDDSRNKGRLASDDPRIMKGFMWALGADLAFGVGTIVGALCLYYFLRDPLPPSEGKHFDPVDLTDNPGDVPTLSQEKSSANPGAGDAPEKVPSPKENEGHPSGSQSLGPSVGVDATYLSAGKLERSPRWMLSPVLTTQSAGLGIVVVF